MKKSTKKTTGTTSTTGAPKGLLAFEWLTIGYAVLTMVIMLFMQTKLQHPADMIWLRVQAIVITLALMGVYRMVPWRCILLLRVLVQIALLGSWYPETFEFNRVLPNLDHVFASWEQQLFGFQPALLFSQRFSSPWVSEPLTMGYVSYYLLMVIVPLFYFFWRKTEFLRASFILLGAFFLFYLIFIFVPVAGPVFYYKVVGVDEIARGVFPNIGNYFETHTDMLTVPGYQKGFFYHIMEWFHEAGERPTAAFPSSHVGIVVVLLWLANAAKNKALFWGIMPFAVLMFFATFYIQAHYAIDAIAGLFAGTLFYFLLAGVYKLLPKGVQ